MDLSEYTKRANEGDVNAQLELAKAYLYGGAGKVDGRESMYWCAMALRAGHPLAKVFYGTYHFMGLGVPKDYKVAFRWWNEAAQDGNREGEAFTAWAYSQGIGTEKNDVCAYQLWRKAAEQGIVNAQISLAKCYEKGLGVDINTPMALFWFLIAKRNSKKDSVDMEIRRLSQNLDEEKTLRITEDVDSYILEHEQVLAKKD